MATRVADRLLLDTNVLLAATDEGRSAYGQAVTAINEWPAAGTTLYTSGQVLREYLSVATRPVAQNGLGLAREDAAANVRALRDRLRFLAEHERVHERLLALLDDVECLGKPVHDANIVATMLVHGIDAILTINVADFTRFTDQIRVVDLAAT